MTYLTKKDWIDYILPKLNDDNSFKEELTHMINIKYTLLKILEDYIFSQKNNQSEKDSKSKIKNNILYSSIIYYCKYKLFYGSDFSENKKIICISCIFLAFKETNNIIDLDWLSKKVEPYLNSDVPKKGQLQIKEIKHKIVEIEFEILYSIQFNMGIDNPYFIISIIKVYLQKIEIDNNIKEECIELIHNYINLSILFPLFLYYTSYEIALGSIFLVKEEKKYNFINIDELIKLNNIQIDSNNVLQCAKYIFKITEAIKIESLDNYSQQQQQLYNNNNTENNLDFGPISSIGQNH